MILHGDCIEQMKLMPDNSVDAVVTDPPYGWRFMGKAWDGENIEAMAKRKGGLQKHRTDKGMKPKELRAESAGLYDLSLTGNQAFQVFSEGWAKEALRILKPGGHMLVFCGPRTYHRMASGLEDAGFEIRDQIQWLYGSGFPKSHNLPGGIGTALKPANEPIVLARKPLDKGLTVAENVLKHGCGGLNIDESRVGLDGTENLTSRQMTTKLSKEKFFDAETRKFEGQQTYNAQGRWPANLILDEEAARLLDEQSGILKNGGAVAGKSFKKNGMFAMGDTNTATRDFAGDTGGASRFFYCAKASKSERNAGLEGMAERNTWTDTRQANSNDIMTMKRVNSKTGVLEDRKDVTKSANHHPTVKPIKLMEYLIKLICPPGGVVLDPFAGSGSTLVAAKRLGFKFIGIEMNEEYVEIANKRVEAV